MLHWLMKDNWLLELLIAIYVNYKCQQNRCTQQYTWGQPFFSPWHLSGLLLNLVTRWEESYTSTNAHH